MSEHDLPSLDSLILRSGHQRSEPLRRSPRKHGFTSTSSDTQSTISAVSSNAFAYNQRKLSPSKCSPSKRVPLKSTQSKVQKASLHDIPCLTGKSNVAQFDVVASAENRLSPRFEEIPALKIDFCKDVIHSPAKSSVSHQPELDPEENDNLRRRPLRPTSKMSRVTQSAVKNSSKKGVRKQSARSNEAARFVLGEARCDDFDVSSGSEGEDRDTDLSGFIVDDNAELSTYESSSDGNIGPKPQRQDITSRTKGRLRRGHRKRVVDSEEEDNEEGTGLAAALKDMSLGDSVLRNYKDTERRRTIEVVDLTSSPVQQELQNPLPSQSPSKKLSQQMQLKRLNIFEDINNALKLQPSSVVQTVPLPSKTGPIQPEQKVDYLRAEAEDHAAERGPETPPVTPPRSPTKLKSPSKLLSPSKRGDLTVRSPHRQSMDAFWDHNTINEWNDEFSPKKAPAASPRKNLLARFNTWSDSEDDLSGSLNDSSDSLPSPCESPSKPRNMSSTKEARSEQKRLAAEKKARKAQKKEFDDRKDVLGMDLLQALDKNITDSQIFQMTARTGGINIIWSKTLRSTAGRANWRRTVTKASGSPIKATASSAELARDADVTVQHYANIELAEKVIDREERLVNTLAHEFCHLANFMVSGVRDQPHGDSFKRWAAKVTKWMKSQTQHPEWHVVEVTTKHGYVIEHKYLWVCAGKQQTMTMKMLNLEDEEGCGAEYGRHSKSIDVEKHRCGRCKGRLVQVRPKPRASPVKSHNRSPFKKIEKVDVGVLEKMVEVIELSE